MRSNYYSLRMVIFYRNVRKCIIPYHSPVTIRTLRFNKGQIGQKYTKHKLISRSCNGKYIQIVGERNRGEKTHLTRGTSLVLYIACSARVGQIGLQQVNTCVVDQKEKNNKEYNCPQIYEDEIFNLLLWHLGKGQIFFFKHCLSNQRKIQRQIHGSKH